MEYGIEGGADVSVSPSLFKGNCWTMAEWHEGLIEAAKSIIASGQQHVPVFFVRIGGETIPCMFENFQERKDAASAMMRWIVTNQDPDEYLFMADAWVRIRNENDEADAAIMHLVQQGALEVSQLPDKLSCLVLTHGTRTKERSGMILYARKPDGTYAFEPIRWMDDEGMHPEGRFVNLGPR